MCTVTQHDITQVSRCIRGKDLTFKSIFCKSWQHPRMIYMCMRQEHIIHFIRRNRKPRILIQIRSLLHSTINQNIFPCSLKEMTAKEYEACCTALEKLSGQDEWRQKLREELRRKRSLCLNLMQKLGIDTSDWARINDFCSNPRIVGKAFRQITVDELDELAVKLRSIQRKGGLKPRKEKQTINPVSMVSLIQIDPDAPAN